jgi:hypothetical protein
MNHFYRSSRFLKEAIKLLCISSFGIGLVWLPGQAPSIAQTCNVYGCSKPGAGECNVYGCPEPGAQACNVYGCPKPGAPECNVYGCPPASNTPPPPTVQSTPSSDRRNFSITNNTSQTIIRLYVSKPDSKSWGENILEGVVPSGGSAKVTFSNNSELCMYDVKAVYADKTYDQKRHNLCTTAIVDYTGTGGDYAPK